MATIGTFSKTDNGYTGAVKTLALNVKARIAPVEKTNDKAASGGGTKIGTFVSVIGRARLPRWRRSSRSGRQPQRLRRPPLRYGP